MVRLASFISTATAFALLAWSHVYANPGRILELSAPMADADYIKLVQNIQSGDTLIFSNGHQFRVGALLGEGNTSRILALANDPGKVLRIPLSKSKSSYIRSSAEGYRALKELGVPTVKLNTGLSGEYLVADRVGSHVSLQDLINRKGSLSNHPEFVERIKEELKVFMRKAAPFSRIGDLHAGNLVYDIKARQWTVLDFTHDHLLAVSNKNGRMAMDTSNTTLVDNLLQEFMNGKTIKPEFRGKPEYAWLEDFSKKLRAEVTNERIRLSKSPEGETLFQKIIALKSSGSVDPALTHGISADEAERWRLMPTGPCLRGLANAK